MDYNQKNQEDVQKLQNDESLTEEDVVLEDFPETGENDNELVKDSEDLMDEVGATEEIMSAISGLSEKLDEMNMLFSHKIQHTEHEEKIVDQMHAELQRYKEDLYSQLVRPILIDIIDIRESILHVGDNYASKPEGEQNVPLETFIGYTYDIEDILDKNNITIYDSNKGDTYVPLRHKVVKKISTHDEELHGRIAECFSSGYEYMGKTVIPEKVAVYVYQKEETKEEINNG